MRNISEAKPHSTQKSSSASLKILYIVVKWSYFIGGDQHECILSSWKEWSFENRAVVLI